MRSSFITAVALVTSTATALRAPAVLAPKLILRSPAFHAPVAPNFARVRLAAPLLALSSANKDAEVGAAPAKSWDAAFKRRRLFVFACTVIAYSAYYLVRNSIYYTAPAMVAAPDLAVDITAIGVISSVFPLTYGCSKFVSGVVGDVLSPRAMLATKSPKVRSLERGKFRSTATRCSGDAPR